MGRWTSVHLSTPYLRRSIRSSPVSSLAPSPPCSLPPSLPPSPTSAPQAIRNSALLAAYMACDPRARPLCLVVKHWAKRRAVNEAYRGTLSSYCWVLMTIHVLQLRPASVGGPVLPCLQSELDDATGKPDPFDADDVRLGQVPGCPWDATFRDPFRHGLARSSIDGGGDKPRASNQESLGDLLWAFFCHWHHHHDHHSGVASVRMGKGTTSAAAAGSAATDGADPIPVLTKKEKGWERRAGTACTLWCVEDPFDLSHNLGRTVDREYIRLDFHPSI